MNLWNLSHTLLKTYSIRIIRVYSKRPKYKWKGSIVYTNKHNDAFVTFE